MRPEIKKIATYDEEVLVEGYRAAETPWRMFAVAAVVSNPWAGRFVERSKPEIQAYGPILGELMSSRMIRLGGTGDESEACGKAAVVGLDGEVEHASGLIHTLRFGNHYRKAVEVRSCLASTNTRGPVNAPITVPLMDKNDAGRRSHSLTIQFAVSDAPRDDEIVVVLSAATGGRPHHRIGDRYQDLRDLGHDVGNPASV
jgi:hypothetical protein